MGFPFIAPLKEWITQSIDERESNKAALNTLMPFVVLSSAAVVTNKAKTTTEIKSLIQSSKYDSFAFKGCVVANSINVLDNYQVGKTIVGYDLDGKPIEVEGEENRRVSTPIIESVEIDTDGANNTLKVAQVKVRVFTLKQLEMFELFFLRPSMNVVLEYGWNTNIRNKDIDIVTKMFANKNHENYLKQFAEIFSHKENAYKIAKGKYLTTLKDTKGNYDFMAGKVTNFNYSPEADGTYSINITISAGNELQLWMPIKRAKDSDKTSKKDKDPKINTGYNTWVNKLAADLNNPEFIKLLSNTDNWKPEFFNWGKSTITKAQKETTLSKEPYISFKLILHLLNNMKLWNEYKETITWAYYEDNAKTKPLIPISSNYLIISPTTDFILPGKLPNIRVKKTAKQKDIVVLDAEISKLKECLINGKSFNVKPPSDKIENITIYDNDGKEIAISSYIGNLLNLYFNYNSFKKIYNDAYTAADVINGLLDTINNNMFGLCKLGLQKESDVETGSPLIIMDVKLDIPSPTQPKDEIYRFKVKSLNSIVKEFSFNMELSTLMQAQALYASQLALAAASESDSDKKSAIETKSSIPEKDPFQHADLSYAKNADGYYSINAIEVQIVKDAQEWNNIIKEATEQEIEEPPAPPKDGQEEIKNASEVFNKNYIRFKSSESDKAGKNFIYTDAGLIQKVVKPRKQKTGTTALTYLKISLVIDGIAGISCGEYFHIHGVPEIYNQNGFFQVENVKQGIDESGWKTTIEAGYRIKAEENV
jgi:hypothetical protein